MAMLATLAKPEPKKKPLVSSSSALSVVSPAPSTPSYTAIEVNEARSQTLTDPGKSTPKAQGWTSKFTIYVHRSPPPWIQIVIAINTGANDEIFQAWGQQIAAAWNDKFSITDRSTGVVYPIRAQIVRPAHSRPAHYTVEAVLHEKARLGRGVFGTEHMLKWGALDRTGVGHEFGHMIGNKDEYGTVDGVDYSNPSNVVDTSIMRNQDEPVRERHFGLIADQVKKVLGNDIEVTKNVKKIAPSVSILNLAPKSSVTPPSSSAPQKTVVSPVSSAPQKTVVSPVSSAPTKTVVSPVSSAPTKTVVSPVSSAPQKTVVSPVSVAPKKTQVSVSKQIQSSSSSSASLSGGHEARVAKITKYLLSGGTFSKEAEDYMTGNKDWTTSPMRSDVVMSLLGLKL